MKEGGFHHLLTWFPGVGPQPFDWDVDTPERLHQMFNIMAIVSVGGKYVFLVTDNCRVLISQPNIPAQL